MREAEGLDIAGHRAIQITREMCLQSDLILVMDSRQRRALEEKFYFSCGRIFRLGEFSKNDIADPFQRGEAAFISAMNLIRSGSAAWHERIQKIFKVPA
jgi:protein-tyrosine phosphatase